jgi:hypothetical protein
MLGIPAVADRVAQTVVARYLMRRVEPIFHPDSFGYRPGRSALDAVGKCRERCWKRDWVVEFDIAKFFDSVPWDLLVKAVEAHTDAVWVSLYVRRWLAAPLAMPDGSLVERERGTPQGAPVSPVLANHKVGHWRGACAKERSGLEKETRTTGTSPAAYFTTGARWGLDGAEAVLKLRALRSNGDFDDYWRYHTTQEHQRNHLARFKTGLIPTNK